MSEPSPMPIVVAVGTDEIDAALAFAAREAATAGSSIHLVHVVHLLVQGPDGLLVEVTDQEEVGRLALNAAVARMDDLVQPGTTVTTDMQIGRVVPTLVDMAQDARMIVLEHRELSMLHRVVTRSVASGVAAVHRRHATAGADPGGADADGGGFPRPVRSEEAEDAPLRDVERDPVEGGDGWRSRIGLGEVVEPIFRQASDSSLASAMFTLRKVFSRSLAVSATRGLVARKTLEVTWL